MKAKKLAKIAHDISVQQQIHEITKECVLAALEGKGCIEYHDAGIWNGMYIDMYAVIEGLKQLGYTCRENGDFLTVSWSN